MVINDHAFYAPALSYTVGNVVFKTTNMIANMFGKNFFKHIHINTRMAYTEFAINSNKEFIHKNKPLLGINPVVDLINDDIAFYGTHLMTNKFNMSYDNLEGGNFNFLPFFYDDKIGNYVGYLLNRIRINFDIVMNFNTVMEQINMFGILNTMWNPGQIFDKKTAIEIQLPRPLLRMISVDSGIPMVENNSSENFLKYLNMHCNKPVTYQMKNSTGEDEFFMYYPLTIEYLPDNYNMDNVEKIGQTINSAPITFNLRSEFNCIQMFDYGIRNKRIVLDKYDLSIDNKPDSPFMIPIFTADNLFRERNDNGWRFYTTRMYKIDQEPDIKEDKLDLSSLFKNTNVKDIIAYHNRYGIDNHIFFDIQVWGLDKRLKEKRDYEFDFKTLTLITKKLNKKITYRFVIYINDAYINDLVCRVNEKEISYQGGKLK